MGTHETSITPYGQNDMAVAGIVADTYARQGVLEDYHQTLTANTRRRQLRDLGVFATYLAEAGVQRTASELYDEVLSWEGISFGLIEGFTRWQLAQGYAIGSINVRLATIKMYASLVAKAGIIADNQARLIGSVKGYSHKIGRNIDQTRNPSRLGAKKSEATPLSVDQANALKKGHPATPEGRRDALLMCLLLDHGLRCGEIADLAASSVDLHLGIITFYREKVDLVQLHRMTSDTRVAAKAYLPDIRPGQQKLFMGYSGKGLATRSINDRVRTMGLRVGLDTLSPHDCRHYWATAAMRQGTGIKALQTAGGWKSEAMPLRYAEASAIANEGVKLP